jgi:3-(3-hydroxy-phenyl)propionate hydroxylase
LSLEEVTNQEVFDVIIAGYGPTGLAAAALLGRCGHSVCVFERWPTLYGQPRIATIDGESARIIQAACDIDSALKNAIPRRRYLLCNGEGQILVDHDWDKDDISGFPYRISIHQPDIEDALDGSARVAGVTVFNGWEVTQVRQEKRQVHVSARYTNGHTDEIGKTATARFMIGADGARSTTRALLGIEQEAWPFRNAWFTVDATRNRTLPDFLGVSPDGRIAAIFGAPLGKSHSIIPLGKDVVRFNFEIDPDIDRASFASPAVAYRYLHKTYDLTDDDVTVFRQAVHVFEGRLAEQWRAGNVFLAGDAAHAMTPFMGQGGCSAFRDAINLSWKLDLVLRGITPCTLLDSYESERKPHVRSYVASSDSLGAMVFTRDPQEAAERDRIYLQQSPPAPSSDVPLGPGIFAIDPSGRRQPPAGELAPQGQVVWNDQRGRFDDIFGWGFQFLYFGQVPTSILRPDQVQVLRHLPVVFATLSTTPGDGSVFDAQQAYAEFFHHYGIAGLIVRPDFISFGGARSALEFKDLTDDLIAQLQVKPALPDKGTVRGAS